MKNSSKLFYAVILLILGSCCGIPYPVDFHNETPGLVRMSYATLNMDGNDKWYKDTVSYEIEKDSVLRLYFKATYNNSVKKLGKCILFFKFETPEKSVCLEGPEEVVKVFSKHVEYKGYEFVINDSLFNCGNKQ